MNKNHLILLFLFSLLGCSSAKKVDDNNYYFNTNVTQNNVKEFAISKEFKARNNKKSSNREGKRGGGRGERSQKRGRTDTEKNSKYYTQLEIALEKELAISNYCINGYTEIERYSSQGFYTIRGECNELNE
ncbi:hypothetical protein Q4489_06785 [Thalassotalea sp. 1_MG-2023]|uniref:hypothetical protein n=1 Tax=Thalassotalea sp. 1_MG-2023 TaxID=3062680 RepID=UPI0026E2F60C|nr:hypothetical protein [Thalassotalea sp. 1_MG-2023]MDO6426712.1 hypothetical protein [Thalassotalea sp. 1_MG-2023]